METDPDAKVPLLVPAACPIDDRPKGEPALTGKLEITIKPGTLAYRIYGKTKIIERFHCGYELNRDYRAKLEKAGMLVSGESGDGGTRLVELPSHEFFLGTGFIPHLSSEPGKPHPVIAAFIKAALEYKQK